MAWPLRVEGFGKGGHVANGITMPNKVSSLRTDANLAWNEHASAEFQGPMDPMCDF